MDFNLSKEHLEVQERARKFVEERVLPGVIERDQNSIYPMEQYQEMVKAGFVGFQFDKKYGGLGKDYMSYILTIEELGKVDASLCVLYSVSLSLFLGGILKYGTEEQKQKYLVPLAKGEKLGAFGLTETNAGSDAGETETTAVLEGDHYILNGQKIFITNAPAADTYVVFAVTTPDIGTHGISAFIVEKDFEGFTFSDHYDKLGIRSSTTAELHFNNVKVPKENLLGKEGKGFNIAMSTLDGGRIGIAAQALGIAQGAYEHALAYAKERVQFGQPLAANQGISFKLADMYTKIDAARLLIYRAAEMKQNGERYSLEAAEAKMFASDIALEVVNDALQIYGGSGYMKGMEVERAYRDAKITTIYEGTNEIQRVVIAANIIGKAARSSGGGKKKSAKGPITGVRKREIFDSDNQEENVKNLIAALQKDGYDFSVGIDLQTPILDAERVVSMGKGFGGNLELAEDLARAFGAAIGSSRPVAETDKILPINRYVGMSGQKFRGNLYVAAGISGAGQHLKGIKDAATIVAINNASNAMIFKNCDYGIVGDIEEVAPLIIEALGTEGKGEAPEMVKMKRQKPRKTAPKDDIYVCQGCGFEYNPEKGDEESEIEEGTPFDKLPEEYICPKCGEEKDNFIKVSFPEDRTFK